MGNEKRGERVRYGAARVGAREWVDENELYEARVWGEDPARRARTAFRPPFFYGIRKRIKDLLFSVLLLALLAFPMLLIAVWVRCDSSGPAIFRQRRVGRGGAIFTIYKFRTMRTSAPRDCPSAELSGEKRAFCLTRAGRVLRRSGLDELPQLWNILLGQMSFVGPRPVIPEERELIVLRTRLGALSVRPGLTGLAQVSGRDNCTAQEKARLDALYAQTMSPAIDRAILRMTVRTVLSGVGCN